MINSYSPIPDNTFFKLPFNLSLTFSLTIHATHNSHKSKRVHRQTPATDFVAGVILMILSNRVDTKHFISLSDPFPSPFPYGSRYGSAQTNTPQKVQKNSKTGLKLTFQACFWHAVRDSNP